MWDGAQVSLWVVQPPPPHPRPAMGWSSSGRQAVSAQKPPLLPGLPLLSSLPNLVQVVVSEH